MKNIFRYGLILVIAIITLSSCKSSSKLTDSKLTTNSKESQQKPYVILISLDGFRWDYVDKYQPPNLINFIKSGVKAASLVPSFPSKTFPNHYTIATGMYPENHGIIGNSFYSYKKETTYKIRDREKVEDGTFYGGTPIWVQADKANMVSASYFFVGSEANIQNTHPTYYYKYDGGTKNSVRVAQALKWLELPEKERPHMITLYFSDMDDIGHRYSPDNDEKLKKGLFDLDKNLGDLIKGVAAIDLPINIIIVSDHGMASVKTTNFLPIEDIENDDLYTTIDNGAIVNLHPKKGVEVATIIEYLKPKENNFKVYKTENTPGFEYTPKNKDWGSVQIIPNLGYYFSTTAGIEARMKAPNPAFGVHGYNTDFKDMHGIFYASGPAFKNGYVTKSFKNIHIYPLMCEILGLKIPNDIDGDLNETKNVLKGN